MPHDNLRLTLAASLFLIGCGGNDSLQGSVTAERKNPDGRSAVIATEYNGGATTSFAERVYLKDNRTQNVYEMLLADKTTGLKVSWESPTVVLIDMQCGHIYKFRNYFELSDEHGNYLKTIELKLKSEGLCLAKLGYQQ